MNFQIPRKYLILLTLGGFIICLDQLTKMYIYTQFIYGQKIPVVDGLLYLSHVRNPGAAFGIFSTAPEVFRTAFFLSMPLIAVGIILYIIWGSKESELWQILSLSLVFGGAIGNYIDRLRFGFVIDFLDITFAYNLFGKKGIYSWPAFNVADIAIVTGVICLMVLMALQAYEEQKAKTTSSK